MASIVRAITFRVMVLVCGVGCVSETHSALDLKLGKREVVVDHKMGEGIDVGDPESGSPLIKFSVLDLTVDESGANVGIRVESAQHGKITYFNAQPFGVYTRGGHPRPGIILGLNDEFENEYQLLGTELEGMPSDVAKRDGAKAPVKLQIIYPEEQVLMTVPFKGPIVKMAETVSFTMQFETETAYETHQWTVDRK